MDGGETALFSHSRIFSLSFWSSLFNVNMMVWGVNRTLWLWQSTINCVSPRWTTREIIYWCMKSRPSTFLLLLLLMSSSVTSPRPQMSCPLRWLSGLTFRCHAFNHVFTDANLIPRRARWLQAFLPAKQHHTWLKPCHKLTNLDLQTADCSNCGWNKNLVFGWNRILQPYGPFRSQVDIIV